MINIKPEELHDKYQQCNKKSGRKRTDESFYNEFVKFFEHLSLIYDSGKIKAFQRGERTH